MKGCFYSTESKTHLKVVNGRFAGVEVLPIVVIHNVKFVGRV